MDLPLTKRWIARWESTRAIAYDDRTGLTLRPGKMALGNPTIGVGLNLNTAAARAAIEALGLNFPDIVSGAVSLTLAQIDQLLTGSIEIATGAARALVPNLDLLPDDKQLVLVDLAFNLGQTKLSQFVHFLQFAKSQMWTLAAQALERSAWFTEVGSKPNQRGGADVAVLAGADPEQFLNPEA